MISILNTTVHADMGLAVFVFRTQRQTIKEVEVDANIQANIMALVWKIMTEIIVIWFTVREKHYWRDKRSEQWCPMCKPKLPRQQIRSSAMQCVGYQKVRDGSGWMPLSPANWGHEIPSLFVCLIASAKSSVMTHDMTNFVFVALQL